MTPIETLCARFGSDTFVWQGMDPPIEVAERVALALACAIIGMHKSVKEGEKDKSLESFNEILKWEVNGLSGALRMFEEQGYGYVGKMNPDGRFDTAFVSPNFNLEWATAKAEQHRPFLETLSLSYGEKAAIRRRCMKG